MVSNSAHALDIARELIQLEADAVRSVSKQLDTSFLESVDLALASTGKIFTVGSGTSGMIARRLAHLLSVCGSSSVFLHPMDALHGSSGALEAGDLLIAISKGGESAEINQLLTLARSRGVKIVALTAKPESAIAALADVTVKLTTSEGADPGGVIAMGSTLVTAVWGDALAYVLMHYNGYSWNEVLEAHPAGAVGQITAEPDNVRNLV
ncbi:SIS domain-containing protein [Arthrobacter sp. EH-1B-1]|uniref:SIS domain-containing protein n=1 Tax=Arthrobacter vasquezii TaxID=2977629 RepID=A0ABT6CTP3_9MICC|nr:SIS domain-containing protein [Arthrobacter vasquezii]MDF9277428.1 SIS domain-containing protein [Arthrobacter vasquezii]